MDKENIEETKSNEYSFHHSVQNIINALKDSESSKKSLGKSLLFLLISVVLFISFGLLKNPLTDIFILIGVLFIHELGHLLAMNLLGYKNVQMFFIPLFGAAVSGKAFNVSGAKKAIVSLAGPIPGIIIGIVIGIISMRTNQDFLRQISIILIFINGLNLLPFYPFDGGRFVYDIIFCRNRYAEAIFKFIAGTFLFLFGVFETEWLIGMIGVFVLISISSSFKLSTLAMELKEELELDASKSLLESPAPVIDKVITAVRNKFNATTQDKILVNHTNDLWERINSKPPKFFISSSLIILYLFSILFSLIFFFAITFLSEYDYKIETSINEKGEVILKENTYYSGTLMNETELNSDSLYHGKAIDYTNGKVSRIGFWYNGKWDSTWTSYDENNNIIGVDVYDKGRFLSRKTKTDSGFVVITYDNLSFIEKKPLEMHLNGDPEGARERKQ